MYTSPIGVFDSGLGGLTVLKSLQLALPNENFIYLGDTAHLPYGNKGIQSVFKYSKNIIDFFLSHGTKAVVIACNTASAVAYEDLKNIYDIPIFDVVTPSVNFTDKFSKNRNVGVIGTYSTINSGAYQKSFINIKSNCKIKEVACPLFVPLIEEGWHEKPVAKEIAYLYLNQFNKYNIDTLILGCTHYPIMEKTIKEVIQNDIALVFSGNTLGIELSTYLKMHNKDNKINVSPKTNFYVTDFPQKFDELGSRFLGEKLHSVQGITI